MNNHKLIGIGFLIALLIVAGSLLPPSRSGDVTEYQEREILLKSQIKRQAMEIRVLKSRDSVREVAYHKLRDSVKTIGNSTEVIKVVYREATRATDLRPDSLNLLNEVRIGRKLITSQEAHINALLALNSEADKLLASKNEIIAAQEIQMVDWEARFNNMVAQKDDEIKQERKRGNKKFFKGVGLGGAIVLVLVIL